MFAPLIDFIDCQSLYNILNEGVEYAKINDPYYLYLLDCRARTEYNESHIIISKNMKRNDDQSFRVPWEAELESRNTIVVYDNHTSSIEDNGLAIECAQLLAESGSKNTVKILKGGFELFSKHYPFLRTQKTIYMPRELDEIKTYPSEIIPGLLYLGNIRHGTEPYIKKHLKLGSYIDCSSENKDTKFKEEPNIDYLKIPFDDEPAESIEEYFQDICNFLDTNINDKKSPCLVFSNLGISRSAAIIIAYLVYKERLSTEDALEKVNKFRKIQPQVTFLDQISKTFSQRSFTNK